MSQQSLQAGQTFAGRYRIERFLAEGGFGAVYVVEQLATEALCALKVLWPHVLGSQDAVEKFEQEARISARVDSEHIVKVIDAGYDDATQMPFLVMELLIGEDMNRLVERQGRLPPDLVVEYLRQVASALDRAHAYVDRRSGARRPIVHRDLKPENLFLSRRENGQPLVKVLDFGIAKVTSATSAISREVKGTPLYMAYEQAAGRQISPQTDIWALGLIGFFLLTGVGFWRAAHSPDASLAQLFGEVLSLPIPPPSERLTEIGLPGLLPAAFDAWFARCVNREASQRFASAGEAVVMLGDIYGIVVEAVGSRPASNLAHGQTPLSLGVPTTATPVHVSPPMSVPQGPTLQSAANPVLPNSATQGALAVSGSQPARRSPALAIGVLGGLTLLAGIGALAIVAPWRTPDVAAASSSAPSVPTGSETELRPIVPEPSATPPAVADAGEAAVPPKTTAGPKPSAATKSSTGKPSEVSSAPPPPTAPVAPVKPTKPQNEYDDR